MAQPETTSSFGYWVRRQRLALDLTQADLARRVNCAKITITKIERDERRPSRQMANLLAEQLAIPNDERARFVAIALGEQSADHLPLVTTPLTPPAAALPPSNLPTPVTPFVGRQEELQQLTVRLQDPTCRLLTLLGAGGFGKTRLALQLAALVLTDPNRYPDGIFFVPLDALENRTLVVPAIAAALDLTFYDQLAQETQLLAYLANKRMLLILDNAEQILEAGLVDRILARAPMVKIVVTTREALQLQQEWIYPIRGMRVEAETRGTVTPDVEGVDALALFQQCALRARPDFDLHGELAHVQQICRLVDGAPLAIALAAGWLKALTAAQVAQELERGVDILASTHRNVPDRHRSMHAILEQSWRYLSDDEQRAFRWLCVFEGGFTLGAAQTIVGASLDVLSGLVDKSMLQLGKEGRYSVHALLRQLGMRKLAENHKESERSRARHAAYFLSFLADRSVSITGPEQREVLREIQAEFDNARTAWLHAAAHGPSMQLRSAIPCLFRFLWLRGRYEEGKELATQAFAGADVLAPTAEEHRIRIALLAYSAQFAATVGDYDQALSQVQIALADSVRQGVVAEQAHCLYVLGLVETYLDNAAHAEESLRSAYNLYHELDDALGIAETALQLVTVNLILKVEPEACLGLVEECLVLFRKLGDVASMADVLNYSAVLRMLAGETDEAERFFRESLDLALAVGNQLVVARATGGLAVVAFQREQWDLAVTLMQQRLERLQYLGHDNEVKQTLDMLCGIYADAGRHMDALALMTAHPEMWRTFETAYAQVGAGAFVEVMQYLPQETAQTLAANNKYILSRYLVVWATLLFSNCELTSVDVPSLPRIMPRAERERLAFAILSALRFSDLADPIPRRQVDHLLARLRATPGISLSDHDGKSQPMPTLQSLAQKVLAIRLA